MTQYDLGRVVGSDGQQGAKGDDGNGIASIVKTGTSGKVDTYTITYTDGDSDTFTVTNGSDGSKGDKGDKGDTGDTGNGISSVTKTGTSGLVDTYTITFTNGNTTTFQVTNGSDATVTIVTSWSATTSDSKVPSEKLAKTSLDGKVDKVTGKGLSTNDFTNSYKSTIDGLSTVATSGFYSDLSNKPSIPSKTSDLTNDSGFITSSSLPTKTSDLTNDGDGTNAFLTQHQSLSNYVQKSSTTGLLKNDGTVMTSGTGSSNWAVGNHTHSGYISTSSTTGLVKNDGSIDTSSYITSSAITGMLTTSDIANNLTTTTTGKVLDASQGKALADLIGDAITYINQ